MSALCCSSSLSFYESERLRCSLAAAETALLRLFAFNGTSAELGVTKFTPPLHVCLSCASCTCRQVNRVDLDSARQSREGASHAALSDAAFSTAVLQRLRSCPDISARFAPEQDWLIAPAVAQRASASAERAHVAQRAGAPSERAGGAAFDLLTYRHADARGQPTGAACASQRVCGPQLVKAEVGTGYVGHQADTRPYR